MKGPGVIKWAISIRLIANQIFTNKFMAAIAAAIFIATVLKHNLALKAAPANSHRVQIPPGGRSSVTRYRAILFKDMNFTQCVAFGAFHKQWVGAGIPNGHETLCHAILWSHKQGIVDLNPKKFRWSIADATDGMLQVGGGQLTGASSGSALLWSGTAASAVILDPPGYHECIAISVRRNEEVGSAVAINGRHCAILWRGKATKFSNLNPKGFISSWATATNGVYQVGYGELPDGVQHALLWSGSAASAIDLNPTDYSFSRATGIGGGVEVGFGGKNKTLAHAVLWKGSRRKCIDLNPRGYRSSRAYATNGILEVGAAIRGIKNRAHAMAWDGSAASTVDLEHFLPKDFLFSQAFAINAEGDIFGIAGTASHKGVAVEWVPIGINGKIRE